ncbi:MAG: hypothetical protein V1790_14405 [Planctomycetota bacterium]
MRDGIAQPGELEPLVTGAEFRALLRVSDRTFRRWLSCGLVVKPDIVIGSAKRWHTRTVRSFIEGNATRSFRVAVGQ